MDVLRSITVDTTEGATFVPFSSFGIPIKQIVSIERSGTQQNRVSPALLNNGDTLQWAWLGGLTRVQFPNSLPFEAGEKILIIYKYSINT